MAAVTPDPQLVIVGLPMSTPPAANAALSASGCARRPSLTTLVVGTLNAPGMWPPLRPGRGSGASPRKRSAGRASTTCADPSASTVLIMSTFATMAAFILDVKAFAACVTGPDSVGRPSAFHLGKPPSSTKTLSAPNTRKVHHTRAAPPRPAPS